MKKPLVSIIIPVFMNETSLAHLYGKLKNVMAQVKTCIFELIFVDDGSTDHSYQELVKLKKKDSRVRIIQFTKNFGQLQAIKAGLNAAKGNAVINMSADLQDSPTLIASMIEKWNKGLKIVICNRVGRDDGFVANMTSKLFYSLMNNVIPGMPKNGFDYFLLDRAAVDVLKNYITRHSFIQGEILLTGFTPSYIPYKRQKRIYGRSQWTLAKKLKYFVDGIITLSYVPIRVVSFLGICLSVLSLLYAAIVVALWLFKQTPFPGYAPLMIVLLFTTGMIMTTTGIIGEYIWRIYDMVKNKPDYVIKK